MKFIYFVIISTILYNCSARWHLKQSQRHERIAVEKGATVNIDTVFKEIEVLVPELKVDTVVNYITLNDTIFVHDKTTGIKTKIKIDTITKTANVQTKVEKKIIVKEVPYTVTKVVECPPCRISPIKLVLISIGTFILGVVVGFIVRSIFR